MADIAKKLTKLDEKISKLKERIRTDTAVCEKLSEQKIPFRALLFYRKQNKFYTFFTRIGYLILHDLDSISSRR